MNDNLREKSIKSFGWKMAQSVCTLGTSFLIQLILARFLLSHEDFGIVALTTVFMTLANTIIETGFSSSVVQKSSLDQKQLSSLFFANFGLSFLVYISLFAIAPLVSGFYNQPILTPILRVQGLRVLFSAVYSIQTALLNRKMEFKKLFVSYLIGSVIQAIVGIGMALLGFGVWALVMSTVVNYVVAGMIIMILSRWRPSFYFSFKTVKSLISFSSKVLIVDIILKVFYNIRSLAMGKVYDEKILGVFNKGLQFPSTAMTVVDGSFIAVAFTSLSKIQDDKKHLLETLRVYVQIMTYLTTPIMLGMLMVAEPMVLTLLTDKWADSIPYIQIICFVYLFKPMLVKTQAFNAIGRSDISMKFNLVGVAISVVLILATMSLSPHIMVLSEIVSTLVIHTCFAIASKHHLGYSYKEQMIDFCEPFVPGLIMCLGVFAVSLLNIPDVLLLIAEIFIGGIIYIVVSKVTHNKSFEMVMGYVKEKMKNRV